LLVLRFADLDVDAAVVLADLALEAGDVDLHHRLARALIIIVGEQTATTAAPISTPTSRLLFLPPTPFVISPPVVC
jgi:hypothetical protein